MTREGSMKLKIGARVFWRGDQNDAGQITETDWASVTIKWGSRSQQNILHNNMLDVSSKPNPAGL